MFRLGVELGLREITGYIAHAVLLVYWLWICSTTAPQLRKGCRDRGVRLRVLTIKTAAFLLTAVVVGVIHYWATHLWHVALCLPIAAALGYLLHREYRRTVAAPRHRLPLARRARQFGRAPRRRRGAVPAHLRTEPPPGVAA